MTILWKGRWKIFRRQFEKNRVGHTKMDLPVWKGPSTRISWQTYSTVHFFNRAVTLCCERYSITSNWNNDFKKVYSAGSMIHRLFMVIVRRRALYGYWWSLDFLCRCPRSSDYVKKFIYFYFPTGLQQRLMTIKLQKCIGFRISLTNQWILKYLRESNHSTTQNRTTGLLHPTIWFLMAGLTICRLVAKIQTIRLLSVMHCPKILFCKTFPAYYMQYIKCSIWMQHKFNAA